MKLTSLPPETSHTDSIPDTRQRFRINSFGLRLFVVIMGGALVGIGGMAFLFGETVKYQAEDQIKSVLKSKVSTINEVTDQAENLAYGLNVSVSTLHVRRAETPETYQELTRQLFQGRPEFVTGLGFGQQEYSILPNQQWFFPYYQSSSETITVLPEPRATESPETPLAETQPPEPRPEGFYTDQAAPDYFYPDTDRYSDYFVPHANLWTTPYQSERGVLLSYYSQIFDDQGEWLGTAVVDIDGTYLSTVLAEPVLRNGGQLILLTKTGDIIANPSNPSELGTQTYENIPGLSNIWPKISPGTPGFIEGETGYWAYTQIPERDWLVLAYVPYNAVFGQVMLITLGATTLVGLLLAGVVALAIRYLNRRLRPVLDECNRLSEIDDTMVEKLKNKDELEQLSLSFFNLLEQLQMSQTRFRQEVAHTLEVEGQLKQVGAKAETSQMQQQEAGEKLADVETQLQEMTARAEATQLRQQEESQRLIEVEAQLQEMTARAEATQLRQQDVAQRLESMLGTESEKQRLHHSVLQLSDAVSLFTADQAATAITGGLESNRLATALNQFSYRLGNTLAQVLSVLDHFVQLLPALDQMTQHIQSLEQAVVTTPTDLQQQTQLVNQVHQWIDISDDLSQVMVQQALAVDEIGHTTGNALTVGQQKISSMASELDTLRNNTHQLASQMQTVFESTDLAAQITREHQRTTNMARVLMLNASTLAIRASQQQQPEEFESIVDQFQRLGTQLQQLTEQFSQSLKQQQDQAGQVQTGVSALRSGHKVFDQHLRRLTASVEMAQQALGKSQTATYQLTQVGQQVTQSSQQLAELARTNRSTIQQIAAIADSTQNRVDWVLQQTQQVEQLAEEMTSTAADFL